MISSANLDMDALRTLVAAQDLGGLNRAAGRVGRSQSAVSQQLKKLQDQVGEPLFRKEGRGLALTEAGAAMVSYARRILALNDEAVMAARGSGVEGVVRFGMAGDFAETWLPAVLGRFRRAHPEARIEALVDRNRALLERLDRGELDLALVLGVTTRPDAERLATLPMRWIGPADLAAITAPLALAVYHEPCFFRRAAIEVLDRAGLAWRVAFTTSSLASLWAGVSAGLGVTLRLEPGLPDSLAVVAPQLGLPPAQTVEVSLVWTSGARSAAARRLAEILSETARSELAMAQAA
ncbi:LysR substrate-binding domain-containing protein [Phenylobacterium montanum]|uniref:LysR family transcriptional regulator n=1 Tax=Phenylobacterium montanum TaxID=2823693 RepID=A0A975IT35_9CAUL|nr:LysR substrate-binding domain-containing protein [Caulobacter sp. S6]QUD86447.1 LysR family transcriptional regulator [Caulobacter sp. S6]